MKSTANPYKAQLAQKDSVIKAQQESLKTMQRQLDDASKTLSYLDSGVTYIGILLAFLAIAIPGLTYIFGIRPTQNFIKKTNKKIDKRIAEHLQKKNREEIGNAIESLKGEALVRNQALNFLSFLNHNRLNNDDIEKILQHIKENKQDTLVVSQLSAILANKVTFNVTEYFENILAKGIQNSQFPPDNNTAVYYFSRDQLHAKAIQVFKKFILNSPGHAWSAFANAALPQSIYTDSISNALSNDAEICSSVVKNCDELGMIRGVVDAIDKYHNELPYKYPYKQTLLYRSLVELRDKPAVTG